MNWWVALASAMREYNDNPDVETLRRMNALGAPPPSQNGRRELLMAAKHALKTGKRLVEKRDSRKRNNDEMTPDEQRTLEDYDTGRTMKKLRQNEVPRLNPFRVGSLDMTETSETHATEQRHDKGTDRSSKRLHQGKDQVGSLDMTATSETHATEHRHDRGKDRSSKAKGAPPPSQNGRRQLLMAAKHELKTDKRLVEKRDTRKRNYDEMTPDEQRTLKTCHVFIRSASGRRT